MHKTAQQWHTIGQSISQELEIGSPNLLLFEKQGVQNFHFQYFCMCIADKTGCPFSKLGVQKTPNGIAGQYYAIRRSSHQLQSDFTCW